MIRNNRRSAPMRYVEDIANLGMADAEEAGGKGANMGELVAAKLPVPPGFVVLRDGYLASIGAAGVAAELNTAHRTAIAHAGEIRRVDPALSIDAGPGR